MTRSRDLANFADSTEFTAADHTKLDGIEASATADQTTAQIKTAVEAAADIDLDGNPTTTTQSAGNNTTRLATTAFTQAAITALVDSSPASLNTLNELAAALGDDASFSTTVTNSIATKLPLAGGTMSGAIAMGTSKRTGAGNPTAAQDLATKAYVDSASGSGLPLSGGAMTGAITTNSTFDGRDVAADGVLATNALPKAGGALTGVLTTNSNVGIGTTTINARLDVDGAAGSPATSGTTQNGIVRIRNATNNNALDIGQISGSPYGSWLQATDVSALGVEYPLHLNPNGGRVGIGVNSLTPLAPLHVRLAGSGSVPVTVAKFETISAAYGRGPQLDFNVYWGSDIPTAKIAAPNVSGGNGYGGELRFSTNGNANANSMAERMKINSSGHVTKPFQPAFSYLTTRIFQIATTSLQTMTSSNVFASQVNHSFNRGSHFNPANGRFTAPTAGTYHFQFQCQASNFSSGYLWFYLSINGTVKSYMQMPQQTLMTAMSHHMYCELAVGDYVESKWITNYASGKINYPGFSGYMVG